MEKLLSGKAETFQILRSQYRSLEVLKREFTGAGFWTDFSVPSGMPQLPGGPSFWFGDVGAKIKGLENGAGFELLVKDGYIHMLEGFSFDEPWPATIDSFKLFYIGGFPRDEEAVVRSFTPA